LTFPQREGRKHRFRCTSLQDRTEELFDLLQLDRGQRQYWLQRYHAYNRNEFTNKPYIAKCVECAISANLDEADANAREIFNNVIAAIDDSVEKGRGTPASPEAPFTEADMSTRERLITEAGEWMLRDQQLGQGGTHDLIVIRRSPGRSSAGRPYDRSGRGRTSTGSRQEQREFVQFGRCAERAQVEDESKIEQQGRKDKYLTCRTRLAFHYQSRQADAAGVLGLTTIFHIFQDVVTISAAAQMYTRFFRYSEI
jgi:hypothetical protein